MTQFPVNIQGSARYVIAISNDAPLLRNRETTPDAEQPQHPLCPRSIPANTTFTESSHGRRKRSTLARSGTNNRISPKHGAACHNRSNRPDFHRPMEEGSARSCLTAFAALASSSARVNRTHKIDGFSPASHVP